MDYTYRGILTDARRQLGPYPLEKLVRVAQPTIAFDGTSQSIPHGHDAFWKAATGQLGERVAQRIQGFSKRDPLCAAFCDVIAHMNTIQPGPVAPEQAPLPEDRGIVTRHLKKFAYLLGADMVGVCRVPDYAKYQLEDGTLLSQRLPYAIVLLKVKDRQSLRASYGSEWIDDPISMQAYQSLALYGETLAAYLRRLGYSADASVFNKYTTLISPLVIAAGLGEQSRLGIALNPFVGAAFKACAVLTDLPLEVDLPIDFGLQDYCKGCTVCYEQCSCGAINLEKDFYNGYETYKLDADKCMKFTQLNPNGHICERCSKACPWNRLKNRPEDFAEWDGSLPALHATVARQRAWNEENSYVDPLEKTDKWWFALEEVDGRLQEAREFDYEHHAKKMARLAQK